MTPEEKREKAVIAILAGVLAAIIAYFLPLLNEYIKEKVK